jgi:GTPase SAR1 family protein
MGCCKSKSKNDGDINVINFQSTQVNKILLLGTGECGKTTVFKQIKQIYGNGFSLTEIMGYKNIIYKNIMASIKQLIDQCDVIDIDPDYLKRIIEMDTITPDLAQDMLTLWNEPNIINACKQNIDLTETIDYFMGDLYRIADYNYIPSYQDILKTRIKTLGIVETYFDINNCKFAVIDVGGQKSERKKWAQHFCDVVVIVYIVAISEYNQFLYEDETVNRLHESLRVFGDVVNNKWFTKTPIILFLNKKDLFEIKIKKYDLDICFPEYYGGRNYDNAIFFINKKFVKECGDETKLYTHVTCVTDTNGFKKIFESVKKIIINQTLQIIGLV